MKKTHFRIIELENYQVLLTKDFDNENEYAPVLSLTFFLDGVKIIQSMGYSDEEKRDKMFLDFTDESGQNIVNSTISMLN